MFLEVLQRYNLIFCWVGYKFLLDLINFRYYLIFRFILLCEVFSKKSFHALMFKKHIIILILITSIQPLSEYACLLLKESPVCSDWSGSHRPEQAPPTVFFLISVRREWL